MSRNTSNPDEFSTTLRVGLAGRTFYLACYQHERFRIGSSDDCKLSIDGEGIAKEHCEIERVDELIFIIRALGGDVLNVTYKENPDGAAPLSRIALRIDGDAVSEVNCVSPFEIELGSIELTMGVVPDSDADGFEDVKTNPDNTLAPYVVSHRRKKNPTRESAAQTITPRSKAEPDPVRAGPALAQAGPVLTQDSSAITENDPAPPLVNPYSKPSLAGRIPSCLPVTSQHRAMGIP